LSPSPSSGPTDPHRPDGLFNRLRDKFAATQNRFTRGLSDLLFGGRALDESLFDELETVLLSADVGVDSTQYLMQYVQENLKRQSSADGRAVAEVLRQAMISILEPCERSIDFSTARPFILLVVGVNGVGKTTTIAKLANRIKKNGHTVLLAAADTFRAAAIDQLKRWAERLEVPIIAQHTGSDAAAVVHDALQATLARKQDVLIVDTAGRQHTHEGLMDELKKIHRVIGKTIPEAPHEVLLVLDASVGQNALSQLKHFHEAVDVTGLVLTKLDGTAKGGMVLALARQFGLPIRYIGVGEGMDDLREFKAREFCEALLPPMGSSPA